MWHEARKQEKKLRGMIVDYRKRAERRREFYEKFKADPTQFMQIHGRPCKIYMDPAITTAADNSLMPWQGNKETIIDRFDVRAHLDYIPESGKQKSASSEQLKLDGDVENLGELNYERYRILVQNELTSVSEDKFLHQIHVEEQYGYGTSNVKESKSNKHLLPPKAAIAYTYEDTSAPTPHSHAKAEPNKDEESDDDLDFDLLVNVNDLNTLQKIELNTSGSKYGLQNTEFVTYLSNDVKERETLKLIKLQEEEKQQLSGRKARRERRAYKDRHLHKRENWSPPSYAASALDMQQENFKKSSSDSDTSNSPERVTYITSFGSKSNETNSPFGPNLPSGYSGRRFESSRRRRRRTVFTSSSSDERRHRTSKKSKRRGRRRRSSTSSSSSSSSQSSARRRCQNKSTSPQPPPPIRRYYGRQRNSKSESNSSAEDERDERHKSISTKENQSASSGGGSENMTNNSPSKVSPGSGSGSGVANSTLTMTPQERLRRRMQAALNKQLKADKQAEQLRIDRLEQERLEREESLREISIKYRKKERERRHYKKGGDSSDSKKSRSRSASSSEGLD